VLAAAAAFVHRAIDGVAARRVALGLGLFFVGEYAHMITTSFLLSILFFGGWHFWWISTPASPWWIKLIVLWFKVACFILFYMFVRWTIPRFRFDQLMVLAWKVMMPLALINLVGVLVVKQYAPMVEYSHLLLLPLSALVFVGAALVFAVANGGVTYTKRFYHDIVTSGALDGLADSFGSYILTASTTIELAEERETDGHGVFTKALIDCLWVGPKDRITINDLYEYAHPRLRVSAKQTPLVWALQHAGTAGEVGT